MVNKLLLTLSLCVGLLSCGKASHGDLPTTMDLNQDRKPDVFYELTTDGNFYEMVDRNFDGHIDESILFDEQSRPIFSRSDNDFDGIYDTLVEYENTYPVRRLVDTNNNYLYDSVSTFEGGVETSVRSWTLEKPPSIQTWQYIKGVPLRHEKILTDLNEQAFHAELNAKAHLDRWSLGDNDFRAADINAAQFGRCCAHIYWRVGGS